MGYCLSCDKEQKTGKFCLVCGRQLASDQDSIAADVPVVKKSGKANLALLVHLVPLVLSIAGFWVNGLLFVLWLPGLLVRNSPKATEYERRQGTESMNFQLTISLIVLVGTMIGSVVTTSTLWLAFYVLWPLSLVRILAVIVFTVMGIMAVYKGKEYKYPLSIRFVK